MAKRHPPEVKAAVMSALLEGAGVMAVADEYDLPTSTVSRWRKEARGEHAEEVGSLLLQYLRENLTTLRAQAQGFRDLDWLRDQNAADVAVLHGVLTDKAVRLLEALEGAPAEPSPSTSNGRNRVAGHV